MTAHDLALARRPHKVRIHGPQSPTAIDTTIILLWHEADRTPGVPHNRPDMWRCLLLMADGTWLSTVASLADITPTAPTDELPEIHPLALMPGPVYPNEGGRYLAETWALCARFQLQMSFDYAKDGATVEARRGIPCGTRGQLAYTLDTERGGALRSFRRDGMSRLTVCAGQPPPRWVDGVGYQITAVTQ